MLTNIEPAAERRNNATAVLLTRPLALARVSLGLEVQGAPATNQSMGAFYDFLSGGEKNDHQFPGVTFPVRLGDLSNSSDGLVGFYQEQNGVADYGTLQAATGDGDVLQLSLGEPPRLLTLLLDPRASVHARSGLFPVKEIDIPSEQYAGALAALELTFLCSPVIASTSAFALPVPTELNGQWSWVGPNVTVPTPVPVASDRATLPTSPPAIFEGWLCANPYIGNKS
jgi:hypothetical protein